jgi:hypothetical protein
MEPQLKCPTRRLPVSSVAWPELNWEPKRAVQLKRQRQPLVQSTRTRRIETNQAARPDVIALYLPPICLNFPASLCAPAQGRFYRFGGGNAEKTDRRTDAGIWEAVLVAHTGPMTMLLQSTHHTMKKRVPDCWRDSNQGGNVQMCGPACMGPMDNAGLARPQFAWEFATCSLGLFALFTMWWLHAYSVEFVDSRWGFTREITGVLSTQLAARPLCSNLSSEERLLREQFVLLASYRKTLSATEEGGIAMSKTIHAAPASNVLSTWEARLQLCLKHYLGDVEDEKGPGAWTFGRL